VAEGARLESVFALTRNVGSNPTLSAISLWICLSFVLAFKMIPRLSPQTNSTAASVAGPKRPCRIIRSPSFHTASTKPCRSVWWLLAPLYPPRSNFGATPRSGRGSYLRPA
jgi:hypothetical protein